MNLPKTGCNVERRYSPQRARISPILTATNRSVKPPPNLGQRHTCSGWREVNTRRAAVVGRSRPCPGCIHPGLNNCFQWTAMPATTARVETPATWGFPSRGRRALRTRSCNSRGSRSISDPGIRRRTAARPGRAILMSARRGGRGGPAGRRR